MAESTTQSRRNMEVPEGLWIRCVQCGAMVYRRILEEQLHVCPECDWHYRINARTRINLLNDPGTFEEFLPDLESTDPLEFTDRITYQERLDKTPSRRPASTRRSSSARASSRAAPSSWA
jgi:acetyl-CoA carboxylase carboxyl transferase subunit beta